MGKLIDKAVDGLGTVMHDHARRAGVSALRVERSIKGGVDPEVLALQVNMNEQRNNPQDPLEFSGADMIVISRWSQANRRRPALTRSQATQLQRTQEEADAPYGAGIPA